MDEVEAFWRARYAQLRTTTDGREATWLDYSSDEQRGLRLQAQTFACVLDALGSVEGARCLDAGCGWGRFTCVLATLGAHATGLDLIDATIETLRAQHPEISWTAGNFLTGALAGEFDRIVAIESFQCAGPPAASLRALWSHLAPGGRLVAIMPNADCPIVQRAVAGLAGHLFAIAPGELIAEVRALPGLARYAMRGLEFAEDQWIAPYHVSDWAQDASAWPVANRILIAVERA
jgi:2-polyprenyl-3-methyl-5-hydroxy-6-metoxy-1,4-benzoquinol methylase